MPETPAAEIEWKSGPVPDRYRGLWRRRLLLDENGTRDTDTIVWWLQSGQLFADIRLPTDRAALSDATCFADLDEAGLRSLAHQEGFAGILEWTEEACAWRRMIDYRPLPGPPDEGWMEETVPGLMIERGIHRAYLEEWEQSLPDGADRTGKTIRHDGWSGSTVLQAGDVFMLAEDRRHASPQPEDFKAAILAAIGDETALAALLDCEISFGRIENKGDWLIVHSTIPWREGTVVTPR